MDEPYPPKPPEWITTLRGEWWIKSNGEGRFCELTPEDN